jgi:hypothetical protein
MFLFNILLFFFVFNTTSSLPIELGSQVVPAEAILPKIVSALTKLDSALKSIPNGGSFEEAEGRATELIRLQMEYTNIMRDGSRDVRRGQNMLPPDGMRMIQTIYQVGSLLQSTTSGWVRAKAMVVAAEKRPSAYQGLLTASDATAQFTDTFVSKMPAAVQSRGKSFAKECIGYLEAAIKAYQY